MASKKENTEELLCERLEKINQMIKKYKKKISKLEKIVSQMASEFGIKTSQKSKFISKKE
ncbi:MAG TPA: hypothetical protein PKC14_03495 [Candidatus Absconditabacterales bacterium]|nr:hypothetical protein [Candidatus Absconditabacterales bacterium]